MSGKEPLNFGPEEMKILRSYLVLAGLQCAVALASALQTRSESGAIFGLSPFRLVLAAFIVAALMIFGWLLIETWRQPGIASQRWDRLTSCLSQPSCWWRVFLASGVVFLTAVIFLALAPAFEEPVAIAYAERLTPLIGLAAGLAAQTSATLLFLRRRAGAFTPPPTPRLFFLTMLVFIAMLLAWGWAVRNVMPSESSRVGWNRQGAPLIEIQVFVAWVLSAGMMILTSLANRSTRPILGIRRLFWERLDLWLSILIWLAAVIAWQKAPITPNWFLNQPFPPNFENYPSSDARAYDTVAQTALVGEGYVFYGRPYIRRSLLAFYMTVLHLVGGQDYPQVIFFQILVLALIPVVLYHLTRHIHTRYTAILMAVLVILREANSIRISGNETTSNAKLLMADMPTLLLVVVFALLLTVWLKRIRTEPVHSLGALVCGGGLGLSMLIRLETSVFLAPAALTSALILWPGRQFRAWLRGMLWIVVGVSLVITPWVGRNYLRTGQIFIDDPYFSYDLLFQRYHPSRNSEPVQPESDARYSSISAMDLLSTPAPVKVDPIAPIWQEPQPTPFPATPVPREQIGQEADRTLAFITENLGLFSQSIATHYLHNQVQMFLILPTTVRGFESTLAFAGHRSPEAWWNECCRVETYVRRLPYWNRWNGTISFASLLLLIINLALIAWGVQITWRRTGWAGMAPIFMTLTYLTFNSLFRNSGGRYILPVDWTALLYFSIGMSHITQDLAGKLTGNPIPEETSIMLAPTTKQAGSGARIKSPTVLALVSAALLAIGCLVPLMERSIPQRYTPGRVDQMSKQLFQSDQLTPSERQILQEALLNGANLTAGRALFPRYFAPNVDDPGGRGKLFDATPYPRMTFFLAGTVNDNLVLPIARKPKLFPNGSDALAVICPDLDILAMALYAPDGALQDVFLRSPFPTGKAGCPLPAAAGVNP